MYSRRSETITDQCPAEAANREVVTTKCQACRAERRRRPPGSRLMSQLEHRVSQTRETVKQNAAPGHMQ
jgi:cytochrome c5